MGDLLQTLPFKQFLKEPEPDGKYEIIQQGNEPVIGFANGTPCGDYKDVVIFGDHTLSLYKPQHPFFVATDGVRIVKGQQDTDGYYLLSLLERYKPQSEGYKRYYSILADTNCITTYNTSEQEKIGVFFKLLDNLITLHQRKFEKLTNVKKSMLEKMFPQNGSSYPEIRFKGFTDPWEQRKLGDIGETYTGLSGKTKADFGHGQARFVTYMNVFSNPISNPEMTEPIEIDPKQNEVEVGDVLFTTSSETPEEVGMSSVLLEKRGKTYLNSFCFGFRPSEKIDSYYLAYMLRSESAREKIILLAQGISRYNISKNKVMEIAVSLPSLDEQKLIGQCFRQLDHLITLHQRKLEKLQNIKKSMLEKMFV